MGYSVFPVPREQLEGPIVRRAWADPDFKALLLREPRRAVQEVLGIDVPDTMEIDVLEERPDRIVIVVPVDTSGFRQASVNAMTGRPPTGRSRAVTQLPVVDPRPSS